MSTGGNMDALRGHLTRGCVALVVASGLLVALSGATQAQDPDPDPDQAQAQAQEQSDATELLPANHRSPASEVIADRPDLDELPLDEITIAGSHNTYQKRGDVDQVVNALSGNYEYLMDALNDSQVVELDVYALDGFWYVTHDPPLVNRSLLNNVNTCPKSGDYNAPRDQDLWSCLQGLRKWHDRHPGHPLVVVKLELKAGFLPGNTPAGLDAAITASPNLPRELLYTPADLMCQGYPRCTGRFATPDDAAKAGNWATARNLRGKFMFTTVTGKISSEASLVPDGSKQYATALAAGQAGIVFPSQLLTSAPAGADPRTPFFGANTAKWVVVFDMESGYVPALGGSGAVARATLDWMGQNRYLRFLTVSKPARPCSAAPDPRRCRTTARDRLCPLTSDPARCVSLANGARASSLVDIVDGNRVLAEYVKAVRPNVIDIDQERAGMVIAGALPAPTGRWDSLGGVVTSSPVVAAWGNGYLELFVRGGDNALWTRSFGGRGWSPWSSLGGVITSDPAAVAWDDGTVDVYARGGDNAYWHRTRTGGTWSGWSSIGGVLTAGPGVASPVERQVDVFGRAGDGELWQYTHVIGGNPTGWRKVGGRIESDPDAMSWGAGVLDVYARGPNNDVVRRVFQNGAWGAWESLGGVVSSGAAPAAWPFHVEVFVRGTDAGVWRKYWTPSTGWVGWSPELGGQITGDPDATASPTGVIQVFVRGTDNAVYRKVFAP